MNYTFELETLWLKVRRKFQGSKPQRFWTSDIHFCHKNVIEYCDRPFKDVQEMNEALVRRWNAMVLPQDEVYVLGDFAMNDNRAKDFGRLLNGHKMLVPGNHDHCFWSTKRLNRYSDGGFEVLSKQVVTYIGKYKVLFSHMPYLTQGSRKYDVRYPEYRPERGNEDFLLHGHLHAKYVKSGNCIDVGIDHNFRLYSEQDILRMFKENRKFIPSRLDGKVSKHGEAM